LAESNNSFQDLEGPVLGPRGFFEDHMGIGSANPKGIDTGSSGSAIRFPF
jgi:hypothetical protein